MDLDTVIDRMPNWYRSGKCFYLVSQPGVGKTATISRAPGIIGKKLNKNLGISIINGALLTPMHVMGFGLPKHHANHSEMVFSRPFFWRTSEGKMLEEYDGGIIFVDEADKMDIEVKKGVGEAAYSDKFGAHQLPPGWVVWMAGNTAAHRSGSTKELDMLINRRTQVPISASARSFDNWAAAHGVTPEVRHFADQNVDLVFADSVPEIQGPWCTSRSLVETDDYHKILAEENGGLVPLDSPTTEETAGAIGGAAAAKLFASYKLSRGMPKFEKIVADPMGVPVSVDPSLNLMINLNLAHRVEVKNLEPVIQYVQRMPQDFALSFCRSVVKRVPAMAFDPAMKAWSNSNKSLLMAMQ